MESLHVEKPIYPLLSLISSILIFIVGLLVSKEMTLVYFLLALTVIYFLFGYIKILARAVPIFFVIGAIIGGGSALSSGDYLTAVQTAGRILLLAYSSVIMVGLPPIALIRNLVQLKFPRVLTLGMLATIRFVPMVIGEAKNIREAMKTRGAALSWRNLTVVYRAFIIPFIMRIMSISDIMAISIETRGFVLTDNSATAFREVKFTLRDLLFLLSLTITMAGVILIWVR